MYFNKQLKNGLKDAFDRILRGMSGQGTSEDHWFSTSTQLYLETWVFSQIAQSISQFDEDWVVKRVDQYEKNLLYHRGLKPIFKIYTPEWGV